MNTNSKHKYDFFWEGINIFFKNKNSFESAEEVFRATAEIVTNRAKQNKEEVSARWEPLFNNLGHCCRKTRKYKEALEYHQFVSRL